MNKLHSLLFVILTTLAVFGQEESATTPFPMDESALLWEIRGDSIEKGSYLFGTMHLIEKEYFLFPKKLEKIAGKAEVLVMELGEMPNQQEALQYMVLKEGTFFDYFTVEQSDSILTWANEKMGITEEMFRASFTTMKPFVVVQMATQMQFIGKTESYELTFEKIAKENDISITGLETIAEQMAVFDSLSTKQMSELVMESIRKPNESVDMTKKMMEVYNRQQIDSLYILIHSEGGVIAEEQNSFLDERNENWIPKIEAILKEKRAFIAVGAGHLGGPDGLIRLLEEKGYTLVPVHL